MACAQCHHHKYDPISQEEYFRFFAIFNNSEDADRDDEAPVMKVFTEPQKKEREPLLAEVGRIEELFRTDTPESAAEQVRWEQSFPLEILWQDALGQAWKPIRESQEEAQYAGVPDAVLNILELGRERRTDTQKATLAEYYRAQVFPALASERKRLKEARKELADIEPTTVPVMRELQGDKRRTTHVQLRGNFRSLAEEVTPGVPEVFPPLPEGAKPDRLALAQWLVSPDNPLSARVVANRLWEQIFGTGIVRTVEDFGSQGDLPTHPELLDWLATELLAQGWNLKAFLKELVTSATYCQSSRVSPELLERDPANLLLARGPRYRMPAEEVRDQALFVSGLLSEKMYGPPVRPPQPSLGLSAAFGSSLDWKTSEGEDRYRRALYIEWRRTNPYASLATFDAPNREVCALKRPRSNTPLQALVTLNDPVYVEAAQSLARRMAQSSGSTPDKVTFGFELCLSRLPRENELERLVKLYDEAREDYAKDQENAKKFATDPLGPDYTGIDVASLAALTAVGNVLLNLDETLMRP
jgi:hypothetical protein